MHGLLKMVSCAYLLPFTPIFMKLHMQSPHESSMEPMDFGVKKVKGQGHNARITEKGFWRITASPLHLSS